MITIKHGDDDLYFEIKTVGAKTLAELAGLDGLEEMDEIHRKQSRGEDIGVGSSRRAFRDTIWPMFRLVLPVGCVNPKVEDDEGLRNRKPDVLYLEELPLDVLHELLSQILKLSGFVENKEQEVVLKK